MSRARNPELETTELRIADFPRDILNFLDGKAHARNTTRNKLIVEALATVVAAEAREMIVVQRVVGGNPALRALAGMEPE
jgi:hypothetical protein